jgi:hypothetical protein
LDESAASEAILAAQVVGNGACCGKLHDRIAETFRRFPPAPDRACAGRIRRSKRTPPPCWRR